ncbi:MAG: TRAP transporter large permease [Deltaproteobacteria bacterium]|nr:TRAP transporter large permease [Deltaproteobacteria bacterium]
MLLFILVLFFVFLLAGIPIAFVLGSTTYFVFLEMGNPKIFKLIPQRMFGGVDDVVLMAIPFFILAGEVMNQAKITDGLVRFANVLVGHLRGGMAHVNILASIIFAGISGSAVADTVALGKILIPAMVKDRYDEDFSAAVTAASSIIGPIIPPSIVMIIYASIMRESVAALFLGGFLPGLLLGIFLMGAAYISSRLKNYGTYKKRASFREFLNALKSAIHALLMPFIILGGILGGICTPTEAAAIAVAYGLLVGFFWTRELKPSMLFNIVLRSTITSAMILFVIGAASLFGWLIAFHNLADEVARLFFSISDNPYIILLLVNIIMLLAGMFMDLSVNIVILAPLLAPLVIDQIGLHPLHFGMIMIVNLTVGLATPPVGLTLFAACGVSNVTFEQLVRRIIPFIMMEFIVILLVTYIPFFSTFLPRAFGYIK